MKASELIKAVAAQSGITNEDPGLQQLLGNKSLDTVEVDDEVARKMTAPRMTMEAAKASPDLKRHFTAQALDGVDAKIKTLMDSDVLSDELKATLSGSNTYDKVEAIKREILELKAAGKNATQANQHTVNKEIERLNAELKAQKDMLAKQAQDFEATRTADRTNWEMDKVYSTYLNQLALDEKIPAGIRLGTAKQAIAMKMAEKGITVQLTPEGTLELMTKEGTPFIPVETNVKPTINDFVKNTLLENGLLQTKIQTPARTDSRTPANNNTNQNLDPQRAAVLKRIQEHNAGQLKQFGA